MRVKVSRPAKRPPRVQYVAWLAAVLLLTMVLAQLFQYEDFANVLAGVVATNDSRALTVIAAGIVSAEVFALPYLLAMKLSPLMRVVSALCGLSIAVFWFFAMLTSAHASNSALFGSTLVLSGGLLAAGVAAVLFVSVSYTALWSLRETTDRPLR